VAAQTLLPNPARDPFALTRAAGLSGGLCEEGQMSQKDKNRSPAETPEDVRESGLPGGGAGRRDEVGGSGVHPASAGKAPRDAAIRTPAEWGQGDRGAAGYEDSGESELFFYDAELRGAGIEPEATEETREGQDAENRTERSGEGRDAEKRTKPGKGGQADSSGA
jgi:hypothetical protein